MAPHEWIHFIDTYAAGYRREVFQEIGGFETAMIGDEDQEFSFWLAQKGYKLRLVPAAAVYHRHPSSFCRYLQCKFTMAYWKTQLLRWHPDQALGDSHTPLSQRLPVLLIVPVLLSLAGGLAWRPALLIAAGLGAAFLLTTLPFLVWVARKDWPVLALAFPMLAGRALAQALGLVVGRLSPWRRKPIRTGARSSLDQLIKRAADNGLALISRIVAAPVMEILSLLIRLQTPGPVIFRQTRIGQYGRPFQIYKLPSMVLDAEERLPDVLPQSALPGPASKMPNDPRVTRLGRHLRRWSLDEWPQLWNGLRSDMSLVGRHPEEPRSVAPYSDWHRRRLAVKPGLTGPRQVHGRGSLALDERVRLELGYLNHYSPWRDLGLLLRAVPAVLSGDGAC